LRPPKDSLAQFPAPVTDCRASLSRAETESDVERECHEDRGDEERVPPSSGKPEEERSVGCELLRGHVQAEGENDREGEEEADRRGRLDPRRVETALVVGCVLRDVDRGAAVLAAESEALKKTQRHQNDRREDTDLGVRRQKADEDSGETHDRDRDEERVFATDDVPERSKEDRTEWPDEKTGRVCCER